MGYRERMNEAVAELLRERYDLDAVEVIDFQDKTVSSGYCETCYYEYVECDVTYKNSAGEVKVYNHYGSFSEFIRGF